MADSIEKDYLEHNQDIWNQRLEHHLNSELYDLKNFKDGKNSLDSISLKCLGDVKDKEILHLQCHFGQDTMSMARLGAKCTGIDLSDKAINAAQKLNVELGLACTFVQTDVYSVPERIQGEFDIVFSTFGTIGWLPDMDRWAKVVKSKLKPGGKLILIEFHPFIWMYDTDFKEIAYSYFNTQAIVEESQGTYTNPDADIRGKEVSWNHPISEVLNALISNGLQVSSFEEFDYSPYSVFGKMEKLGEMRYRTKDHGDKFPYFYALQCLNTG